MTAEQIKERFTEKEIEDIFRYQQLRYATEDAEFYIGEFLKAYPQEHYTEEERQMLLNLKEKIAKTFLDTIKADDDMAWDWVIEYVYNHEVRPKTRGF